MLPQEFYKLIILCVKCKSKKNICLTVVFFDILKIAMKVVFNLMTLELGFVVKSLFLLQIFLSSLEESLWKRPLLFCRHIQLYILSAILTSCSSNTS